MSPLKGVVATRSACSTNAEIVNSPISAGSLTPNDPELLHDLHFGRDRVRDEAVVVGGVMDFVQLFWSRRPIS